MVAARLEATVVPLGNLSFNLLWLIQFFVVGGVIFWLGRWSNDQSSGFINKQEEMRPPPVNWPARQPRLPFSARPFDPDEHHGISLTSLAVLGGAVGVGLGFGLQKIASNFISGVILLLEGQATVGDYVELDGGEAAQLLKPLHVP